MALGAQQCLPVGVWNERGLLLLRRVRQPPANGAPRDVWPRRHQEAQRRLLGGIPLRQHNRTEAVDRLPGQGRWPEQAAVALVGGGRFADHGAGHRQAGHAKEGVPRGRG